ncbi:MAG: TIGR00282 family metallophosphoesterase [Proteobacteria bacterium]|nr:TIGR00282 family metallophosphoesterase [Pseudomonadota bacterium]
MAKQIGILFIGDIVGKPGRLAVAELLPGLREQYNPGIVIANVENSAGGFGVTPTIADDMLNLGIDLMTSGNHIWDRKEIYGYISEAKRLIRPANYPEGSPGRGSSVVASESGVRVGVMNLAGRVFMDALDCPFKTAERELESLEGEADIIIVDMHAETTSEAMAMGWFLDGRVSAVIGTHTHVQTADERILKKGTAFITDAGMTGPTDSVIGMNKEFVLERFISQMPVRFEVANEDCELHGVFVTVDADSSKALSIERIKRAL